MTYEPGWEEQTRLDAEQRVLRNQAPDSNQQLGQARTCHDCGHTAVPRPWTPGWTPAEHGWICPDCTRRAA